MASTAHRYISRPRRPRRSLHSLRRRPARERDRPLPEHAVDAPHLRRQLFTDVETNAYTGTDLHNSFENSKRIGLVVL
jgi:hypothetical protein